MNKTTLFNEINNSSEIVINNVDVLLGGEVIGQVYVDDEQSDDGDSETVFDLILNNKVVRKFTTSPDVVDDELKDFVVESILEYLR